MSPIADRVPCRCIDGSMSGISLAAVSAAMFGTASRIPRNWWLSHWQNLSSLLMLSDLGKLTTAVDPCEGSGQLFGITSLRVAVADAVSYLESGVFDRAGEPVPGAGAAEREEVPAGLENT